MKAAVTGATGLVGRQVCAALRDAGHEVRAVVRSSSSVDGLTVPSVRASLADVSSLRKAFAGSDLVAHCAAVYAYGADRAADLRRVNVEGTRNVIVAAAEAGVRRVVVTSSSVTAGSSIGPIVHDETGGIGEEYVPPYFLSKVCQEQTAFTLGAEHGVEVVVGCPTIVLGGPVARLVPSNAIVLRYLIDPTRSTFPGGCNVVSVADVARGHVLLAESGTAGERYLICGENLSWRTLHALVAELAGIGGPYAEAPTSVAYVSSAIAEAWSRLTATEALSTREEALTVGRHYWYSHDKLAGLGYCPASARAAIASALAWLLVSPSLPRWLRDGLRPLPEVRAARPLIPRPL